MNVNFFSNLVEQSLLTTHTCYLAKVISVSGNYATVQPLTLTVSTSGSSSKQAVISNAPIASHALCDVSEGATVICACMERDISQARKGIFAIPSKRRHSLSDSVVIGVIAEEVSP